MQLHPRHPWTVSPEEAVAIQRRLRGGLVLDTPLDPASIRLVAGVDVSVKQDQSHAAVVVATFPGFEPVETVLAQAPTPFPYVPGLLSFREGPVLEEALARLRSEPELFLVDGMGTAHPRRMGIACHMGLWLERPTIGCGKTLLVGRFGALSQDKGAHVPLIHRGETIGAAVRTRAGTNPMFISPGHRCDIASAVAVVMACSPKWRIPEPIRLAHNAAGAFTP
ncbi:MAG TPA: deoxyribonuclease V [Salinarimonas sp.]|nr:deoxyribonuclease V [Salinarimonas sp.]